MDTVLPNSPSEKPAEADILYRQFLDAGQESVRLSAALKGFFLEADLKKTHRDAYSAYLKKRIRPAVSALIAQEDTDKLAQFDALGWLDERLTDEFLQSAQIQRKPAAFVWLLQMKQRNYGFHDRDFSL